MSFKIGFMSEIKEKKAEETRAEKAQIAEPRKSVVRVHFKDRDMTCSYYNDLFDLHVGSLVYVEGKLEGCTGRVVDIAYNFKIKLSDYKRVIAVADTEVHGEFSVAGSHFITFDRTALPFERAVTWFKAPENDDEEYAVCSDGESFCLGDLGGMKISSEIAERGHNYYVENRVAYIELDGEKGRAIVEGSHVYTVEFEYRNGEISNLTCDCYCIGSCKHEFAAMLQLREDLDLIEKNYPLAMECGNYFSAIRKSTLFEIAIDGKNNGSFTVG